MIVYALIDPRNGQARYVGKTFRTLHRRLRRHLADCYLSGETHKEHWLRLLLRLGLEPEIIALELCSDADELSEAECFWIAYLRFIGADLTNATPGGEGAGFKHTAESKKRISLALKGKPKSARHRLHLSRAGLGRVTTETTRAKLRAVHRSRPRSAHTEAHCVNMSRGRGGRAFVDQLGTRYETQNGAARQLGLNVAHVNAVLHGRRPHTRGFIFTFVST